MVVAAVAAETAAAAVAASSLSLQVLVTLFHAHTASALHSGAATLHRATSTPSIISVVFPAVVVEDVANLTSAGELTTAFVMQDLSADLYSQSKLSLHCFGVRSLHASSLSPTASPRCPSAMSFTSPTTSISIFAPTAKGTMSFALHDPVALSYMHSESVRHSFAERAVQIFCCPSLIFLSRHVEVMPSYLQPSFCRHALPARPAQTLLPESCNISCNCLGDGGGARDAAVAVSPLIMGSHTFASRLYLHSAACRHIAGASSSHTGARTDRSTIKRKKGDQRAWKGDFGLGSSKAIKFKNHPAKVYKYMINFFLISHAKSSVYTAKTGCAVDRGQNEYVFPCKEQRARWPRSSIKICCADEKKKGDKKGEVLGILGWRVGLPTVYSTAQGRQCCQQVQHPSIHQQAEDVAHRFHSTMEITFRSLLNIDLFLGQRLSSSLRSECRLLVCADLVEHVIRKLFTVLSSYVNLRIIGS